METQEVKQQEIEIVPTRTLTARRKNLKIIQLDVQGYTPTEIGEKMSLTAGRIWAIMRTPMYQAAREKFLKKYEHELIQANVSDQTKDVTREHARNTLLPQAFSGLGKVLKEGTDQNVLHAVDRIVDLARHGEQPVKTGSGISINTQSTAGAVSLKIAEEEYESILEAARRTKEAKTKWEGSKKPSA